MSHVRIVVCTTALLFSSLASSTASAAPVNSPATITPATSTTAAPAHHPPAHSTRRGSHPPTRRFPRAAFCRAQAVARSLAAPTTPAELRSYAQSLAVLAHLAPSRATAVELTNLAHASAAVAASPAAFAQWRRNVRRPINTLARAWRVTALAVNESALAKPCAAPAPGPAPAARLAHAKQLALDVSFTAASYARRHHHAVTPGDVLSALNHFAGVTMLGSPGPTPVRFTITTATGSVTTVCVALATSTRATPTVVGCP